MFSEKDLVERSIEDMEAEVKELLADAERLREEHERALQKEMTLRTRSVESRPNDGAKAEQLWQEAEELRESAQEMLRLSMEKRLRAGEIYMIRSSPWTDRMRSGARLPKLREDDF